MNSNYPKELEMQCREWIEMMLGESVNWGVEHETSRPGDAFADAIDNGIILCRYVDMARKIAPSIFAPIVQRVHVTINAV